MAGMLALSLVMQLFAADGQNLSRKELGSLVCNTIKANASEEHPECFSVRRRAPQPAQLCSQIPPGSRLPTSVRVGGQNMRRSGY